MNSSGSYIQSNLAHFEYKCIVSTRVNGLGVYLERQQNNAITNLPKKAVVEKTQSNELLDSSQVALNFVRRAVM